MKVKNRFLRTLAFLLLIASLLFGCKNKVSDNPDADISASGNEIFQIHFIDVGQADSALVICGEQTMLIDGGNAADSSLIYAYLKKYSVEHIDYMIATHAHEDHIGGLSGALNYADVDIVYTPTKSAQSETFKKFVKQVEKNGAEFCIPNKNDSFLLGDARVDILGCNWAEGTNNSSIVLKITYKETSFLFTGDAEREAEQAILDSGADLKSTLLKVGHHGSANSTTYPFLREIMPQYAIISVGKDNSYGHPSDEAVSKLKDAGATIYRTDKKGTIICSSDGKNITFTFEKNQNLSTDDVSDSTEADYVLNTATLKFHLPSCSGVEDMSEKNKSYFKGTREELIELGYVPCKRCNP